MEGRGGGEAQGVADPKKGVMVSLIELSLNLPKQSVCLVVALGNIYTYNVANFRCKIVDKHLAILAPKHVETKFCKINAEKCPFLTDRLKIR
jgi:hypothetical protein